MSIITSAWPVFSGGGRWPRWGKKRKNLPPFKQQPEVYVFMYRPDLDPDYPFVPVPTWTERNSSADTSV